jgi:hypothetical protein
MSPNNKAFSIIAVYKTAKLKYENDSRGNTSKSSLSWEERGLTFIIQDAVDKGI